MSLQQNSNEVFTFISEFLVHLMDVTGFSKQAFTRAGLTERLKVVGRRFYQLDISGELLYKVLELCKILADTNARVVQKIETFVISFLEILEKVVDFLVNTFLGRGVLIITSSMSSPMVGFIIGLYFFVIFLYNKFSSVWFMKLKEYVISHIHSEKFLKFFQCFESTRYAIQ